MALQNSYDSKITKLVKTPAILLDIKKSALLSPLKQYSSRILYITEDQADVPLFTHPLYEHEHSLVYIDVRPYSTIERDGSLKIRNEYDHELAIMRAKLEIAWQQANRNEVYSTLEFSNGIFTRWLGETISHKYGLMPIQQVKVTTLVAMYVIGQYFNVVEDELSISRHLQMISRDYSIDSNLVLEVAGLLDNTFPRDIEEFVQCLKRLEISPRLREFNTVVLYNMLGGSWFLVANQQQIVGLGLEFPPAFASLVYLATQYTAFKRSGIGQRVDKANRRNAHAAFNHQLNSLINSIIEEE